MAEIIEKVFKRKIYKKMLDWKNNKNGSTALLIKGARRVGKSTIAEDFAKNEYESYVIINFDDVQQEVWDAVNNIADIDSFFFRIQFLYGVTLTPRKSVVVFDEIQKAPKVRQAIKYLVKDHRYDYIETGSLLSIKKNVKDITIPSEETRITMYPMDYEEFKWALGDTATIPLLHQAFISGKPLGDSVNRKLLRDFRLYMLVGGMPQAVKEYIETNNFRKVDLVKRDILNLYEDDFRKIDSTGRAAMLFDAIPAQLNKNASRYQISSVLDKARAEDLLQIIAEMNDSKTILLSYHANDPNAGLSANKDLTKFKMFVCDTGLFTTLMFKDRDFTENVIYEKLLNDKLSANLGYLYENVTAQILAANGNELFYHTFLNETTRHNYEIDFLLTRKNKICPLEIKASGYKTHTSLDIFCRKFSARVIWKYLVYTKDYAKDSDIICLPVYMTPFI